jgi:beta-galactosidase
MENVSVRMHATRPDGIVRLRLRDGQTIIAQSDATLSDGIAHADFSDLSLRLWDVRDPYLYQLDADFGEDHQTISFGARKRNSHSTDSPQRQADQTGRIGPHQNYPYVGYAMPEENQAHDAEMLKAMGLNIVRTSHYPQARRSLTPVTVSDCWCWRRFPVGSISFLIPCGGSDA